MSTRGSKMTDQALEALRNEERYVQSTYKQARRVKIEKGRMWRVRFLPARMGASETWYARIAKHWLGKNGIVCAAHTHPDYGGDPDAYCPCCEVAKGLNDSRNEEESKYGYRAMSTAQWLTYCCVFEKDGNEEGLNEVLSPYEFNHYKSSWESLRAFYMAGASRSADSILDYMTGNDFVVSKTSKGMQLDKQDSMPIFDEADPKFDEWIAKVEEGLKTPKVVIPTEDALNVFATKIEEGAPHAAPVHRASRRGAAPADYEEDHEDTAEPEHDEVDPPRRGQPVAAKVARPPLRGTPAAAAPAARPVARPAARPVAPAPEPEPEPEAEAPAPRVSRSQPVRSPSGRPLPQGPTDDEPAEAEPAPEAEEPPRVTAAPAAQRARAPLAVPPARRLPAGPDDEGLGDAPPAEAVSDADVEAEPPARSTRTPTRATAVPTPKAPVRRVAPVAETTEEDNLPEETTDSAPPVAPADDAGDEPTPIASKKAVMSSIRNKITGLKQQQVG